MKLCNKCNKFKEDKDFFERHDRDGKYSWCVLCMDLEARSKDYPKIKDRGFGSTRHR